MRFLHRGIWPYRFLNLAEFFELGTESAVVGVPCKATVTSQFLLTVERASWKTLPNEEL